jgi:hypothetical protein
MSDSEYTVAPYGAEAESREATDIQEGAVPDNMGLRLLTLPRMHRRRKPYDGIPEPFGADLRGLGPIHVCPCGSQVFNVMCSFEDYELVWYFLDATCVSCGNLVTAPCLVDRE